MDEEGKSSNGIGPRRGLLQATRITGFMFCKQWLEHNFFLVTHFTMKSAQVACQMEYFFPRRLHGYLAEPAPHPQGCFKCGIEETVLCLRTPKSFAKLGLKMKHLCAEHWNDDLLLSQLKPDEQPPSPKLKELPSPPKLKELPSSPKP